MRDVRRRLAEFRVGTPLVHRQLALYPLLAGAAGRLEYITLPEALDQGALAVTEASPEARVGELLVANRSTRPVLMVEGEELLGAKQNRLMSISVLVPVQKAVHIPVRCSEQRRWSRVATPVSSGGLTPLSVRIAAHRALTEELHASGDDGWSQETVWTTISEKLSRLDVRSTTRAIHDAYSWHEQRLARVLVAFAVPPTACGVAVAMAGRLCCIDAFDSPRTLRQLAAPLLRSYAIEAVGLASHTGQGPAPGKVTRAMVHAALARWRRYKSPGLGDHWRFEAEHTTGAALLVGRIPVHIEIFPMCG